MTTVPMMAWGQMRSYFAGSDPCCSHVYATMLQPGKRLLIALYHRTSTHASGPVDLRRCMVNIPLT